MTAPTQTPPASASTAPAASVWSALAAVYVLWGSTYLGIAVVVQQLPPLLSAGVRFASAGVILMAILIATRGIRSLRVSPRELAGTALIAVLLLGIGNGGVSLASRYVPSSVTALVIASTPLWIVLFRVIARERPAALTWAGVAFGFIGVTGLVVATGTQDLHPGSGYVDVPGWQVTAWLCVVVLGAFSWALGSFIAPKLARAGRVPRDSFTAAAWQFIVAGLVLSLSGLARGESVAPFGQMTAKTAFTFAYLIAAGLIAYGCYVWLLNSAPISLVSTYAYVNPVVAVFLGWAVLDEPLTAILFAVGACVIAGVALVVMGERPRRPGTGSPPESAGSLLQSRRS